MKYLSWILIMCLFYCCEKNSTDFKTFLVRITSDGTIKRSNEISNFLKLMYTKDGSIIAVMKSGEGSFEVKRLMIEDL